MLWACPDDDLDPVITTEKYDESIYHKFVRPPGWEPPRQRTTSATPALGDWVVIEGWKGPVDVNGKMMEMPLDRSEGVVVAVDKEANTFKVALGGNEGIGGSGSGGQGTMGGVYADVPAMFVYVMILPILRLDDYVRVTRGKLRGEDGIITSMEGGSITVALFDAPAVLPIEFIEKIHKDERV